MNWNEIKLKAKRGRRLPSCYYEEGGTDKVAGECIMKERILMHA